VAVCDDIGFHLPAARLQINLIVEIGGRTPGLLRRGSERLNNITVVPAAAVVVAHIVAIDEIQHAALASAGEQMRMRGAANGIRQQNRSARAEVGVGVGERELIVGREIIGERQIVAR
jgi:hypothetical protein